MESRTNLFTQCKTCSLNNEPIHHPDFKSEAFKINVENWFKNMFMKTDVVLDFFELVKQSSLETNVPEPVLVGAYHIYLINKCYNQRVNGDQVKISMFPTILDPLDLIKGNFLKNFSKSNLTNEISDKIAEDILNDPIQQTHNKNRHVAAQLGSTYFILANDLIKALAYDLSQLRLDLDVNFFEVLALTSVYKLTSYSSSIPEIAIKYTQIGECLFKELKLDSSNRLFFENFFRQIFFSSMRFADIYSPFSNLF